MATTITNRNIPDIFADTNTISQKKTRKRKSSGKAVSKQLNEVIYGQRPFLRAYSNTLQRSICFVNEGLMNPDDLEFDGKIITMEMLAGIVANENSVF